MTEAKCSLNFTKPREKISQRIKNIAANSFLYAIGISMNNEQCIVRPTLVDLNLDELHYYPFIISMNGCDGGCNTTEDPIGTICVPNKMEDMNLKVFNMIKMINISETPAKNISCECRYEFGKNGTMIKVYVSVKNQ